LRWNRRSRIFWKGQLTCIRGLISCRDNHKL
jgi:hypothetical protein